MVEANPNTTHMRTHLLYNVLDRVETELLNFSTRSVLPGTGVGRTDAATPQDSNPYVARGSRLILSPPLNTQATIQL